MIGRDFGDENPEPNKSTVYPGMQVAYIPRHAFGKLTHPDVKYGFVTSMNDTVAFCRYWAKVPPGTPPRLRTTDNSEGTPYDLLVAYNSVPDSDVQRELKKIYNEKLEWEEQRKDATRDEPEERGIG